MSNWPATVDEILHGDQIVGFAYVTPASGVVLQPLTNMGHPTEPVSSSVGMYKKLQRIQKNPHVAVAYHTRKHGFSERPEYVLVQGRGSLTPVERRDWIEHHRDDWVRFAGPLPSNRFTEWWLREYHWRVGVELDIARVFVWSDLACDGDPAIAGTPPPDAPPPPQKPPGKGTAPRIPHEKAARRAAGLPHVLVGWVGSDGFPVVVPVEVLGAEERGIRLQAPKSMLPDGGRRAGLLAHDFARHAVGQNLAKHTGWLEPVGEGAALYAPHTRAGYHMPESRLLFKTASAIVTKWRAREARREGFIR
jgi:hypothetical protein